MDKNYTLPIIEVNENIPMVALHGSHPGLLLALSSHFKSLGLEAVIATDSATYPLLQNHPVIDSLELANLINLSFDYLICVDPSSHDLSLIDPLLDHLSNHNGKAAFVLTKSDHLNPLFTKLSQRHPTLDYRLIAVYHLFGSLPPSNPCSPLESILLNAFITHKLTLAQNLDQILYPVSYQAIVQGITKTLFKTDSFQKKFYLSSLEKVSLETLLLEFKRFIPDLDVTYTSSTSQIAPPPLKKIISTQAEIGWYPQFDHPKDTSSILTEFQTNIGLYNQTQTLSPSDTPNNTDINQTASVKDQAQDSYHFYQPKQQADQEVDHQVGDSHNNPTTQTQTNDIQTTLSETSYDQKPSVVQPDREGENTQVITPSIVVKDNRLTKPSFPQLKTLYSPIKKQGRVHKLKKSNKSFSSTKLHHSPTDRKFGFSKRGFVVSFVLLILTTIIFGPFIFSIYTSYLAVNQMNKGYQNLLSVDPESSQNYFAAAENNLNYARAGLTAFLPTRLFFSQKVDKYDRLLDSASRVNTLLKSQTKLLKNYQDLYEHILTRDVTSTDFESLKTALLEDSQNSYNQLVNIELNLDRQDFDSSFPFLESLKNYKQLFSKSKIIYNKGISLFKVITAFFGQNSVQNILVVVQNDTELRPTGGFLDTVGILTIKDGQIIDYSVQDIYSLDQQLKGFVSPPDSLKKYLGEPSWFLRDSNWEPNLPQSAKEIIWFYEKESNRVVDGVIFIDTTTLSKIAEVTGPISIDGWSDPINSLNLKEKVLFEPRSQSKEGEQQYLLTQYLKLLIQTLITQGKSKAVTFASLLIEASQESHVQFFHKDPNIQSQISAENLSGELAYEPCFAKFQTVSCVNETFGIFEANVGINKVNYYLKRSIDHQVMIDNSGMVNHKIILTYQNTSPSSTWPGGDYKAFVRFYSPLGSDIAYIKQDGVLVGLESQRAGSVFSFLESSYPIKVTAGSTSEVEIYLRSPKILNPLSTQNAISISWQKQSGTSSDPLRISLNYPDFYTATEVNQNSNSSPGRTQFLSQFQTDTLFAVSLQKKQ